LTPVLLADSSRAAPTVVGLMIGGAISWAITRRALRKPSAVGAGGNHITDAEKRTIWQTLAAIYSVISFAAVAIALVLGETAALILAIISLAAGLVALVRLGLPRDHPAWRWVAAAISRR
jgi:hypothetical protein